MPSNAFVHYLSLVGYFMFSCLALADYADGNIFDLSDNKVKAYDVHHVYEEITSNLNIIE